jgi:hypothetical protein
VILSLEGRGTSSDRALWTQRFFDNNRRVTPHSGDHR